jgi:hypothetical protein
MALGSFKQFVKCFFLGRHEAGRDFLYFGRVRYYDCKYCGLFCDKNGRRLK